MRRTRLRKREGKWLKIVIKCRLRVKKRKKIKISKKKKFKRRNTSRKIHISAQCAK